MNRSDSEKSCLNNLVWVNVRRMLFKNYKHDVCFYSDPFYKCCIAAAAEMTSC